MAAPSGSEVDQDRYALAQIGVLSAQFLALGEQSIDEGLILLFAIIYDGISICLGCFLAHLP